MYFLPGPRRPLTDARELLKRSNPSVPKSSRKLAHLSSNRGAFSLHQPRGADRVVLRVEFDADIVAAERARGEQCSP